MVSWFKRRVNGKTVREELGCKVENLIGIGPNSRFVTDAQIAEWDAKQNTDGTSNENKVSFKQAEKRENIKTGETQATLFGKVQKWFADLGAAAFCKVANNLVTDAEDSLLTAKQGKALKDMHDEAVNGCKLTFEEGNFFIQKDSVKKKLGSTVVKLGTGNSFNLTSYPEYKSFTTANFLLDLKSFSGGGSYDGYVGGQYNINKGGGASATPVKSYNPSTGILTISGMSGSSERHTEDSGDQWAYNGTERGYCNATADVYLVY